MDALAAGGLRYANFRTCAMCSPTRAALMTGLNHHSAGMGWLADVDAGYPGYRGDLTLEAATLAEVLRDRGWSTLHVGKWHVNLAASYGPNGPVPQLADQPRLRARVLVPGPLDRLLQAVRADRRRGAGRGRGARRLLRERRAHGPRDRLRADPEGDRAREALLSAALLSRPRTRRCRRVRATATPIAAPTTPAGTWCAQQRLERQRALGLVPETTQLPPLSPGADPWDTLDATQKRVYARYMEVYAGLITNLDANIGRFLAALDGRRLARRIRSSSSSPTTAARRKARRPGRRTSSRPRSAVRCRSRRPRSSTT